MSGDELARIFGDLTVVQLILWVVALGTLAFVVVKLWPVIKKFVATVDALSDLPAKLPKIDRIEKKVAAIETKVQDIHHETHLNSGTSIKDATIRIEQKVDGLQKLMEDGDAELSERVDDLEHTLNQKKEK